MHILEEIPHLALVSQEFAHLAAQQPLKCEKSPFLRFAAMRQNEINWREMSHLKELQQWFVDKFIHKAWDFGILFRRGFNMPVEKYPDAEIYEICERLPLKKLIGMPKVTINCLVYNKEFTIELAESNPHISQPIDIPPHLELCKVINSSLKWNFWDVSGRDDFTLCMCVKGVNWNWKDISRRCKLSEIDENAHLHEFIKWDIISKRDDLTYEFCKKYFSNLNPDELIKSEKFDSRLLFDFPNINWNFHTLQRTRPIYGWGYLSTTY